MDIVIIAAVRLYREGLADVLRRGGTIAVVGTADSGPAGVDCVRRYRPDLVLVDTATPGGVELLLVLRAMAPETLAVALGVVESGTEILACIEAGAVAYVPRDGSLDDLVLTLERAGRGEAICPPDIMADLLRRVAELAGGAFVASGSDQLTSRELQVVRLIEHGLTNKEIADRLSVALSTVKNHIHNIFEKLQIRRRAEAAAWARRRQHVQWDSARSRTGSPHLDPPTHGVSHRVMRRLRGHLQQAGPAWNMSPFSSISVVFWAAWSSRCSGTPTALRP